MIKLPAQKFKEIPVAENHPFIVNALRKRKHFHRCWCGSGKKYKKCHGIREYQEPYNLGRLQSENNKVFWRERGCMHPLASPTSCSGKVIDSHTIQRKGPLERIVDATGHVMHFEATFNDSELIMSKIGWRKASVFPGYCAGHDSSLFAPIEKGEFSGQHSHCVLQAFRSICNESYKKRALVESFEFLRVLIDRGFNLDDQINAQLSYAANIKLQNKSLEELVNLRAKFESAIIQHKFDIFESKYYGFQGDLDVVSSSVFQCEYDFAGNKLIDMLDLSLDAETLSHSIMNTADGGAIVFVWLKDEHHPGTVVTSFDNLPDDKKGDIFVQYCFLNCENTFFAEQWWKNLSQKEQTLIQRYANALYYEGGKFAANENRLVNWAFV